MSILKPQFYVANPIYSQFDTPAIFLVDELGWVMQENRIIEFEPRGRTIDGKYSKVRFLRK